MVGPAVGLHAAADFLHSALQHNLTAPRTPNFNEHAADHFDLLSQHPPLPPSMVDGIDHLMRQRWGVRPPSLRIVKYRAQALVPAWLHVQPA